MSKYVPVYERPIETMHIMDKYWPYYTDKYQGSQRHTYEFLSEQRKCSIEMLEYHMTNMGREAKIRAMWSIEKLRTQEIKL